MAVYSSSDEKIEFKEYENLEVKPSSEINTSIQPGVGTSWFKLSSFWSNDPRSKNFFDNLISWTRIKFFSLKMITWYFDNLNQWSEVMKIDWVLVYKI